MDRLWKEEEDAKLRSLVGEKDYKGGEVDWVVVATDLGVRLRLLMLNC